MVRDSSPTVTCRRAVQADELSVASAREQKLDAVVSTPPSVDGADSLNVHLRSPVFGSIAMIELKTSSPSSPPRPGSSGEALAFVELGRSLVFP